MKVYVVCPHLEGILSELIDIDSYIIAVDQGVSLLNQAQIHYNLAVGDFDTLKDLELIHSDKMVLNPEKDVSDTAFALSVAFEKSDEVYLIGGIKGARIDHFYANLLLLQRYPSLKIIDFTNQIELLSEGVYTIKKTQFEYLSVFALSESLISLSGVKYPLDHYRMLPNDPLGLSNEIETICELVIHKGSILLIQSKE